MAQAQSELLSLALAADGRTLAAGNRLGRASFWDVTTGKALRQLQLHPLHVDGDGERVSSPVMPLVFSPDGRALVFGNDYDQITIASAATGQRLHQFRSRCTARSLALSPDGKTLASTGATNARVIHLWETASGKERLQIGDNRDAFRAVIFSADGKTLISGGQDTIRFWDPATGKEVGQLTGHRGAVTALALLPDGQGFVSGSADTTILVWQGMPRRGEVPGPAKLTGPELEALWADLAGVDAGKAYRAIRTLAAAPEQAVPLLRQQLRPVPAPDAKHLARLIADLDDGRFVVRENAVRELEKLGSLASPALREALAGKPSLEVHRRIEGLLERFEAFTFSPEQLRDWRAIEVLERIGTAEAWQASETLGRGAAGARLTEDAKATLQRLAR